MINAFNIFQMLTFAILVMMCLSGLIIIIMEVFRKTFSTAGLCLFLAFPLSLVVGTIFNSAFQFFVIENPQELMTRIFFFNLFFIVLGIIGFNKFRKKGMKQPVE